MKKVNIVIGLILFILALLIAFLPHYILPVCAVTPPMKCHWSALAEVGAGAFVMVGALAVIFAPKALFRSGAAFMTAMGGLLAIAIPTVLIGMCGNPMMVCRTATRPALVILGALVAIISLIYALKVYKSA